MWAREGLRGLGAGREGPAVLRPLHAAPPLQHPRGRESGIDHRCLPSSLPISLLRSGSERRARPARCRRVPSRPGPAPSCSHGPRSWPEGAGPGRPPTVAREVALRLSASRGRWERPGPEDERPRRSVSSSPSSPRGTRLQHPPSAPAPSPTPTPPHLTPNPGNVTTGPRTVLRETPTVNRRSPFRAWGAAGVALTGTAFAGTAPAG